MLEGPRRLHFEELEGAFPLVGGYAAAFDVEVTKYLRERGPAVLSGREVLGRCLGQRLPQVRTLG